MAGTLELFFPGNKEISLNEELVDKGLAVLAVY